MDEVPHLHRHIVIVGPCAAGKSTLRANLQARGYTQVRVVAQEHSSIRDLWKLRGYPEVLIFLDIQPETANARQHRSDWSQAEHAVQLQRLEHARIACDLYLPTDELPPDEVANQVDQFIVNHSR